MAIEVHLDKVLRDRGMTSKELLALNPGYNINRLSIGVQATDNSCALWLGSRKPICPSSEAERPEASGLPQ